MHSCWFSNNWKSEYKRPFSRVSEIQCLQEHPSRKSHTCAWLWALFVSSFLLLGFVKNLLLAFIFLTYLVWVYPIMIIEPDKCIGFDICQYSAKIQSPVYFLSYYSKVDDDQFNKKLICFSYIVEFTWQWKFEANKIEEGEWIHILKCIHSRSSIYCVSVLSAFSLLFQLHLKTNTS